MGGAEDSGAAWMGKVKRDLQLAGFLPEVTWNNRKTVHTGWVRVAGILHEAGLAGGWAIEEPGIATTRSGVEYTATWRPAP